MFVNLGQFMFNFLQWYCDPRFFGNPEFWKVQQTQEEKYIFSQKQPAVKLTKNNLVLMGTANPGLHQAAREASPRSSAGVNFKGV